MDAAGNAEVAYQELIGGLRTDIVANRLSRDGSVGNGIFIAVSNFNDALYPSVALTPSGGQFVVAYDSVLPSGISGGVGTTEMAAAEDTVRFHGFSTDGPFVGNGPAVSIDGFDRNVVTYEWSNPATNRHDVFSRRFFLT
jgi:hypothetical protein